MRKTLIFSTILAAFSSLAACSSEPQEHAAHSRSALTADGDITGAYVFQTGTAEMDSLSLFGDGSYTAASGGSNETGSYWFDGSILSLYPDTSAERDYDVVPNSAKGMELTSTTGSCDETLSFVGGACNIVDDCAGEPVKPNVAMCIVPDRAQTQCVNNACVSRCAPVACAADTDCPATSTCQTGQCAMCPLSPSNDDDNFDALVVKHTWTSADTLAGYTFNADRTFTSSDQPVCAIAVPVHCLIMTPQKTGTFKQTGGATFELDYSDGTVSTLTVEMDCTGKIVAAQASDYGQIIVVLPPKQ